METEQTRDDVGSFSVAAVVAAAFLWGAVGCGGAADGDTEECNSQSEQYSVDDRDYCVYTGSAPITETGFNCPQGYSHRKQVGDQTVCSKEESIPDGHREDIKEEYSESDGDEFPLQVGQNATFRKCENIEKTDAYCAAERVEWSYDSESQVLTVDHRRVEMNCCGERSVEAHQTGENAYEIREFDRPDENGGRCGCLCYFDYKIEIPDVSGSTDLDVIRKKTEMPDSEPETIDVWSGTLSLSDGSGENTITEDGTQMCKSSMGGG